MREQKTKPKFLSALTAERLRELLDYDPETGQFRWAKARSGVKVGAITGCPNGRGYTVIHIDGHTYKSHRLAWLYVYGRWPAAEIDHRNGKPADNRISNLREATRAEQAQNLAKYRRNTSGYPGVSWHKQGAKWNARIAVAGRTRHLGLFDSPEDASAAYLRAKAELHNFQPTPRAA